MISRHGYVPEEHTTLTQDGYFLVLHRVMKQQVDKDSSTEHRQNPVVLIMHGCMMSSEGWVCLDDPERCYPFVLVELGYDVWLGNFRGNKYSHKHAFMKPSEKRFWDFSLDELAFYDIPCMIQYILDRTKLQSLSYIGFSQGSTSCFAALSIHPSLNQKINVFIALAATTIPSGLGHGVASSLIHASPELIFLFFGRHMFLSITSFWKEFLTPVCYRSLLDYSMNQLFGWKCRNISKRDRAIAFKSLYSYTSVKVIVHWFQIIRSKRLQMYDDGTSMIGCNHVTPRYSITNIKCPVIAFCGLQDSLTNIDLAFKESPKNFDIHRIHHYEHLDFLWAGDIQQHVFPKLLENLSKYADITFHDYSKDSSDSTTQYIGTIGSTDQSFDKLDNSMSTSIDQVHK